MSSPYRTRSTIVQTFDNATVIIPNSDFISQQVTNWSFKDPRMRRHVDVGVAYGSDIELVRQALLDIAADTPNVLNFPRPDVLFLDHGGSALIFRLRFWAHVDNYYSTSTDARFELDHRFRELPDWKIVNASKVKLRAERAGKGNGRIYTIKVRCTDESGNSSIDTATVIVPHDKGKKKVEVRGKANKKKAKNKTPKGKKST